MTSPLVPVSMNSGLGQFERLVALPCSTAANARRKRLNLNEVF